MSTPRPIRRWLPVGVALLALLLGCGFSCGDPPPSGALSGTAPGLERWVVYFEGEPDLSGYREAVEEGPKAARAYAKKKREEAKARLAKVAEQLRSIQGNIVDYWWMANAITVEIPAGNVESLKVLPGVKEVRPDKLLGP